MAGQPDRVCKEGDNFQVPMATPHFVQNGPLRPEQPGDDPHFIGLCRRKGQTPGLPRTGLMWASHEL